MTHLDLGIRGSKRQVWSSGGIETRLRRIREAHPSASTEDIARFLLDEIADNEDELLAMAIGWTATNLRRIDQPPPSREQKSQDRAQAARETEAASVVIGGKIRRAILLDLMVPVGESKKRLGDCSGPECGTLKGWFAKLEDAVGPDNTVQGVLSEQELWDILLAHK